MNGMVERERGSLVKKGAPPDCGELLRAGGGPGVGGLQGLLPAAHVPVMSLALPSEDFDELINQAASFLHLAQSPWSPAEPPAVSGDPGSRPRGSCVAQKQRCGSRRRCELPPRLKQSPAGAMKPVHVGRVANWAPRGPGTKAHSRQAAGLALRGPVPIGAQ